MTGIRFDNGILKCRCAEKLFEFKRPADLAQSRLAVCEGKTIPVSTGLDALNAAFGVVPFACKTDCSFINCRMTRAAQEAFKRFVALPEGCDFFKVLRAEIDEYLVFAARSAGNWIVGAFTSEPLTLTVRLEDLRDMTPAGFRMDSCRLNVLRDALPDEPQENGSVETSMGRIAMDARVFIDLARDGGFLISCLKE